jgi:hypothetical protein
MRLAISGQCATGDPAKERFPSNRHATVTIFRRCAIDEPKLHIAFVPHSAHKLQDKVSRENRDDI